MRAARHFNRAARHFNKRWQQRGLTDEVLEFILSFGVEYGGAGARFFTVHDGKLPRDLRGSKLSDRARGWVIVCSRTWVPVTCYRRKDAVRFLKSRKAGRRDGGNRGK